MKWAFLGCKDQGYLILTSLIAHGYKPSFLVCLHGLPPLEEALFKNVSDELAIPLLYDIELNNHHALFKALDFALVCRFSLLPQSIFSLPRLGCINVHCSLLPKYRGIHPIQWALVDGETETGVTIHQIDNGIDTGSILSQRRCTITAMHDFNRLSNELNQLSSDMCLDLFEYIAAHQVLPTPIISSYTSSYARRRTPEDSKINWQQTPEQIMYLIRAMQHPLPTSFCMTDDGKKINVIACQGTEMSHLPDQPGLVLKSFSSDIYLVACNQGYVKIRVAGSIPVGSVLI